MMHNATLLTITPPPVSDNSGGQSTPAAVAIGVDVMVDQPRQSQLMALVNKVQDVTAVMYAPSSLVDQLVPRATVAVQMRGRTTQRRYQVAYAIDRNKDGGLAHVETYLKGL